MKDYLHINKKDDLMEHDSSLKPLINTFADDPLRCQGISPAGQCTFKAEEGTHFCRIHGGVTKHSAKQLRQTLYDLDETAYIRQFADRAGVLGNSHEARSLRSEIGILRATLERLLKSVQDDEGLQFKSGELIALSARIESLEKTSFSIAKEMGELMSLEEAKQLAAELLKILFDGIEDLQKKENFKISKAKELLERIILPKEIKAELEGYFEPLGLQIALEEIADSFGDTINGAGSRKHKN